MKEKIAVLLILICSLNLFGQENKNEFTSQQNSFVNPIIPGGYPDPSICKVDGVFYIVNSSFEYYPGLPIHKSTDLINWELISYGLHREEQCIDEVNLIDVQSNGGIHAPTIRYNKGTFYIITTNVYYNEKSKTTDFVNFIITAKDPAGPWSNPHVLDGAPGIDPDIFFDDDDDDGKVWYLGTHAPEKPNFPGEGEIWLQEIDIDNWKLIGERNYLWRGACGGVWAEGPHMYKRNGWYYLMIAEGGTSYNHAMMIAVSDSIKGPYIANERNPILSTRHLSYDNWVHSTGHADLIEIDNGRWYMVALGIRGDEDRGSNMGRETHLIPVKWEKEPFEWKEIKYEWPVVAPLTGKVERTNPVPFKYSFQKRNANFIDNFDHNELNLDWNFRRVPSNNMYSLNANKGYLRLYADANVIKERGRTSLMGIRQTESDFEYSTKMNFNANTNHSESGISLFQKDDNYITFTLIKENNKYSIQLKIAIPNSEPRILKKQVISNYNNEITFKVKSENSTYSFLYSINGFEFILFETTRANYLLSKGYTGAYLGLYATSNGNTSKDYADFDWVKYIGFEKNKR
jgi:alpha-N-arabinofuranosidase